MSKNELEELRDRAVPQFTNNFEAQGSPKERAEYIAEETADTLTPIHYDTIAEMLAFPYKGTANFLLHYQSGKLDTLSFDADLFKAAQVTISDWLTNEILDEITGEEEEQDTEE